MLHLGTFEMVLYARNMDYRHFVRNILSNDNIVLQGTSVKNPSVHSQGTLVSKRKA